MANRERCSDFHCVFFYISNTHEEKVVHNSLQRMVPKCTHSMITSRANKSTCIMCSSFRCIQAQRDEDYVKFFAP